MTREIHIPHWLQAIKTALFGHKPSFEIEQTGPEQFGVYRVDGLERTHVHAVSSLEAAQAMKMWLDLQARSEKPREKA